MCVLGHNEKYVSDNQKDLKATPLGYVPRRELLALRVHASSIFLDITRLYQFLSTRNK